VGHHPAALGALLPGSGCSDSRRRLAFVGYAYCDYDEVPRAPPRPSC
jgi:hypothetical protein